MGFNSGIEFGGDCGLRLCLYEEDIKMKRKFTGLFDKQGKKIYKGDIIREFIIPFENGNTTEWFVDYHNGYCASSPSPFGNNMVMSIPLGRITWQSEVIGNIYENPRLLKGEI